MGADVHREERPFDIKLPTLPILPGAVLAGVEKAIERLLGLHRLQRLYAAMDRVEKGGQVFDRMLAALKVTHQADPEELRRIPREGPVVVVANHPYGGIDGMILGSILLGVRPDVRFMANYLLGRIPELREIIVPVDPFGTRRGLAANVHALRECLRHLEKGGMVAVFPAGEVAHFDLRRRKVTDPGWSPQIAGLVRAMEAPVLPVFIAGANSVLFQLAGFLHPRLRTAMLPREILNKVDRKVEVRIGRPITFDRLKRFESDREMVEYARVRTFMLGGNGTGPDVTPTRTEPGTLARKGRPIVAPVARPLLAGDVESLPRESLVLDGSRLCVFHAEAEAIPNLLREIGRLREVTFREEGEGTGREIDIDAFDRHYTHLFVWNREREEVVGAYRLGRTDAILKGHGRKGLYTYSLFAYDERFLDRIGPALELGRSFVRPEYQKSYQPLMLLWKGIGRLVCERPQYKVLFGPVSINRDYRSVSRDLMVSFLRENHQGTDLARFVRPRNPLKRQPRRAGEIDRALPFLHDVQELSDLVAAIEADEKGIPILLKQYARLGGRFLGFSLDPNFSDVLDALILVDLTRTEERILERYMGQEAASGFLRFHREGGLRRCA